jgi:FSR family fosmidomycin resistance protein-like MFS transporter
LVSFRRNLSAAEVGLGVLAWSHFLNDGYINYLPAVLPDLLKKLDIPVALVGSLVLALMGVGSLLQPFIGWAADRVGGRAFILLGIGLSAVAASLIGVAPSYGLLIVLLIVAGLGNATFHPQAMSTARSVAGNREGLSMSVFSVGGELGRGVWPAVAGVLVTALGLPDLWLFAIPGALTLILLGRLAPRTEPQPRTAIEFKWAEKRGPVLALVGFVGLRGMLAFGVVTFAPLLWSEHGGSLIGGATLISVMLIVGIAGNLAGGIIADRIGRRPVLVVSSLLSAVFVVLFSFSSGAWLWVTLGFLGIAVFATAAVTVLVGQDIFPGSRSMASGIALGVGNTLGAVVIFLLSEFVVTSYGIDGLMRWFAGLALLGAPLALALPNWGQSAPQEHVGSADGGGDDSVG